MLPSLVRAAVRPRGHAAPVKKAAQARISPIGLVFLLGGLALGSYVLKPRRDKPVAVVDQLKPRVAVVFVLGDSKGEASQAAEKNGFVFIDLRGPSPTTKLQPFVDAGKTKFILQVDADQVKEIEKNVVECDIALNYSKNGVESLDHLKRSNRLEDMTSTSVLDVLRERNLV